MSLPVSTVNSVKIYSVSGASHRTLPDWLERRHVRSLKKDPTWSRRVELIQDFEFPTATNRLRITADGRHMIGVGTYKPQFRVWELGQAALKFERHTTCETVAFELLKEDWTLLALLQTDRAVEFHEAKGMRYRTKIPQAGRDIVLDAETSDLLVSASRGLYVLNLELGCFKEPLLTSTPVNTCRVGPRHGIYALGLEGGSVEFWDRRDGAKHAAIAFDGDITALRFLDDLQLAVGTSEGSVSLLDLRSPRPFHTRDHQNGFAIKGILSSEGDKSVVLSWDRKALKIWSAPSSHTGSTSAAVSMEPGVDINDVVLQSGYVALAVEDAKIASYMIPSLGPAPRWAAYLEHLTEEMEEPSASAATGKTYDNYKFVDRKELASLGLDHLIGSRLLKAYMHGYFIDHRLYEQAKAVANPFAYEEHLAKQKADRLARERASRISLASLKKSKKVNARMAENEQVAKDGRFKSMFEDAEFEVDEESEEWKTLHPSGQAKEKKPSKLRHQST